MQTTRPSTARFPVLDSSIQKTLTNTFISVGAMWLITAGASFLTLNWHAGMAQLIGGFILSFVLILGIVATRDNAGGLVMLALFAAVMGALLGPTIGHYLSMAGGPRIVVMAAGLTAAAVFGCATYCVITRRSFSQWRGFLTGGLMVLIGVSLISMFFPMPGASLAIAGVSAVLFLGWMLFDISEVVNGQETNYIMAATGIYLDTLNLFMDLLRILAAVESND